MEKVTIYALIEDGGDGSAYLRYFLTEEAAKEVIDEDDYCMNEGDVIKLETYKDSNIHKAAIRDSEY